MEDRDGKQDSTIGNYHAVLHQDITTPKILENLQVLRATCSYGKEMEGNVEAHR